MPIAPRLLADWSGAGWTIAGGRYAFALGRSALDLDPDVAVTLSPRRLGR